MMMSIGYLMYWLESTNLQVYFILAIQNETSFHVKSFFFILVIHLISLQFYY